MISSAAKTTQVKLLYLCDGHACLEKDKKCCFTQKLPPGQACVHTSNERHSLKKKLRGFIPTIFVPLKDSNDILIELIDYSKIDKSRLDSLANAYHTSEDELDNYKEQLDKIVKDFITDSTERSENDAQD